MKEPHPYGVFHDFNHDSPLVRAFVKRNLKFLLEEYRIDGFRFDMTKGFTQNSSTEATAGSYDALRIAILKDYNETVREVNPEAVVILEHFCDEKEESELAEEGMQLWRNLNHAYCQSAMGYPSNSDFTPLVTFGTTMPYGGWVGFMESHDEERTAFKQIAYGEGPLKSDINVRMKQLAANASFFSRHPVLRWYGSLVKWDTMCRLKKGDGQVGNLCTGNIWTMKLGKGCAIHMRNC